MPRAEFIHTADVYTGVGTVVPLDYRFTAECRLVITEETLYIEPFGPNAQAYVNYVGELTSAAALSIVDGVWSFDFSLADIWHFPDLDLFFVVWYVNGVTPHVGDPYTRAILFELET